MPIPKTPSFLDSLAEIAGQDFDQQDPIALRYRQMLADELQRLAEGG